MFSWLRPRRRWFQFSIRSLLALTALVACWLSYNAWRFQKEQQVVARIKRFDPEADITWSGPEWLKLPADKSQPTIFHRVTGIAVFIPRHPPRHGPIISLKELTSLKKMMFRGSWITENCNIDKVFSDEPLDRWEWGFPKHKYIGGKEYQNYHNNPNDSNALIFHKIICLNNPEEFIDIEEFQPIEILITPRNYFNGEISLLESLLDDKHEYLKAAAAQLLWDGHSRENASRIIEIAAKLSGDSDDVLDLKESVEADLKPERILEKLQDKNNNHLAWWAWLAALRPDVSLTPTILEMIKAQKPLPEAVYALRQSRDPRALPVMLSILKNQQNKDGQLCCIAAEAIGDLGDASVELQLLDALQNNHSRIPKMILCKTLGKIGTEKSLPELRRIATAKEYQPQGPCANGFVNVLGEAKTAIAAIERRAAEKAGKTQE
jgi:hypothetical protein